MYAYENNLVINVKNRPVKEYLSSGKYYIEGREGTEYDIKFDNYSNKRKKIVISVDGLNVLTGDNTWKKGYVINPYCNVTIPGWRVNNSEVAKFVFSSIKNSYNNHNDTGKIQNVGVIGCMVFEEIIVPIYTNNYTYSYPAWKHVYGVNRSMYSNNVDLSSGLGIYGNTTCSLSSGVSAKEYDLTTFNCDAYACNDSQPRDQQSIGTGWGDVVGFNTTEVNYNFNAQPTTTLLIFYDDAAGLRRRGINIKAPVIQEPQAFPGLNDFGCPLPK